VNSNKKDYLLQELQEVMSSNIYKSIQKWRQQPEEEWPDWLVAWDRYFELK